MSVFHGLSRASICFLFLILFSCGNKIEKKEGQAGPGLPPPEILKPSQGSDSVEGDIGSGGGSVYRLMENMEEELRAYDLSLNDFEVSDQEAQFAREVLHSIYLPENEKVSSLAAFTGVMGLTTSSVAGGVVATLLQANYAKVGEDMRLALTKKIFLELFYVMGKQGFNELLQLEIEGESLIDLDRVNIVRAFYRLESLKRETNNHRFLIDENLKDEFGDPRVAFYEKIEVPQKDENGNILLDNFGREVVKEEVRVTLNPVQMMKYPSLARVFPVHEILSIDGYEHTCNFAYSRHLVRHNENDVNCFRNIIDLRFLQEVTCNVGKPRNSSANVHDEMSIGVNNFDHCNPLSY